MIASRVWTRSASAAGERHTPRPSGPRCASAAPSAADGSGVDRAVAAHHSGNAAHQKNRGLNLDFVVRLHLVFQLHRNFDGLAVHHPDDGDAPIRAAVGQPAGEDDRLPDGRAGVEHERSGILDEARDVESLRDRNVDDVAVLQRDVAADLAELEILAVDRDRVAAPARPASADA